MSVAKRNPYVWTHSMIDDNGYEYIGVMLEEPGLDDRGLYHGGRYVRFEINHKSQVTEAREVTYCHGVPRMIGDRAIQRWKGETLTEGECLLKACEEMEGQHE